MNISYAVITKLGDLSMDEYMLYRTHVDEGIAAVKNMSAVSRHVVDVIAQHHERLDGSGYPDGLTAQNISLLSQLVSLVDCYEELITSTPKRKGKTQEEVMRILRSDAEVSQRLNRTVYRALNSVLHE
jgi:HD-GYP domain-containing protein (c-di-GMP phosphodiesterase class II)